MRMSNEIPKFLIKENELRNGNEDGCDRKPCHGRETGVSPNCNHQSDHAVAEALSDALMPGYHQPLSGRGLQAFKKKVDT